ncbi:MAG: hypothetical protein LBP80_01375 [Treponema sp.]|nr:hypothetical protein [Treponema sp.]
MPAGLAAGSYTLEIAAQYSGGSFFLKEPRVIKSSFALTAPETAS